MLNISKYLEKFKKDINKGEFLNESIVSVIKNNTQIDIGINNIDIKSNIIHIKTNPSIKSKIFINKNDILSEINKSLGLKIIDIR